MLTIQAHTMELAGTSYEIGYRLGRMTDAVPPLRQTHTAGFEGFGPEKVAEAREMFARWCPGLDEELQGLVVIAPLLLPGVRCTAGGPKETRFFSCGKPGFSFEIRRGIVGAFVCGKQ